MSRLSRIAFLLLLLPLLATCVQKASLQQGESAKIQIFYNNDNVAYLEPCGCRVSPIGGMDRRWNAMKAYPEASRVFVDAGDLLFKSSGASEFLAPQWFEQAVGVIEAYNLLQADAVGVGETEFALGLKKFQELARKANFPFLSANIYWKGSNRLLLQDSVLVTREGKKIGIFALFDPALPLPPELEARDPQGHAKQMVAKLKADGAQMVIALSHQGYDHDVVLARAVPGIDLIVGAHSQSLLQKPEQEASTLIVQLSNQGQMLGMVEYAAATLPKERTNFVVAELDSAFNEGPRGLANPMKSLTAVTNLRMQEANKKLDERIWAAHDGSPVGFQTSISCRDCHTKQAEFQEGKAHAAAFFTLMAKHQETNLDCVKCHSVGMGVAGGFESLANAFRLEGEVPMPFAEVRQALGPGFPKAGVSYRADPQQTRADVAHWMASLKRIGVKKAFVNVQCESCHGARPNHPFSEIAQAPKVTLNNCVQCHTRQQAPAWYGTKGKLLPEKAKEALASVTCPR